MNLSHPPEIMRVPRRCVNTPGRGRFLRGGTDMAQGIKGSTPLCSIPDCTKPAKGRGWCYTHYKRWQSHGDPYTVITRKKAVCSIEGCDRLTDARGWCSLHYKRWKATGTPHGLTASQRFWKQVDKTPDCHIWQGARCGKYGSFSVGPAGAATRYYAHRFAYLDSGRDIPEGHHLHHRCHNPLCVRVSHLEVLTPSEHTRLHHTGRSRRKSERSF